MREKNRAILMIVAAGFLWSTGGLLLKWVEWNSLAIAGVRSSIAAITIYAFTPTMKLRFTRLQWYGALAYVGTVGLFVASVRMTTAANAIFLQYTAPIYIALFGAWFLGEKTSRLDWLLIVATQGGVGLFFLDQISWHGFWGNIMALLSGLAFATLVIITRKQKDASPIHSVFLGNALTAFLGLPFAIGPMPGMQTWFGLVILGVFQLGLSYLLFSHAIKKVKALEATLLLMIEPVLNPIWVMIFLHEKPGPWSLLGCSIVLVTATFRGVLTARADSNP